MPHIDPTWQAAAVLALVLVVGGALLRRRLRRVGGAVLEAGIVVSLFAVWQWLGSFTHTAVAGAQSHALAIWHLERALHFPSELALQDLVVPHPWLAQACNAYYLYGHFNPMIAMLAWVWLRHRHAYPRTRLLVCLLTASAFALHFIPVAPPRLVPELGFRDLALDYGQSVYGTFGEGLAGQLLAMPSLHVGWAVLVGYVVVTTSPSRWRWLALLHPIAMTLVVSATANHWWLDGIACAAILALIVGAERLVRSIPRPAPAPVTLPA